VCAFLLAGAHDDYITFASLHYGQGRELVGNTSNFTTHVCVRFRPRACIAS
jgi:hypothetical protein